MSIFDNTQKFYSKYREKYPQELFEFLNSISKKHEFAVDLGCGTGQVTIPISKYFDRVLGVDVSSDMINEARNDSTGINNIEWQVNSSEAVQLESNSVDLITIAKAFHWMDKPKILTLAEQWLRQDGVFSLISSHSLWNGKEAWEIAVKELIQSFLGESRKAGSTSSEFKEDEVRYEERLKNTFGNFETKLFTISRKLNFDSILGYLYSTSFSKKELYGNQVSEFETKLKQVLELFLIDGELTSNKEVEVIYSLNYTS